MTFDKTYDAVSRRTSLAGKIATTKDFINEWTYDKLNRMTQVKQHNQSGGNAVAEKRVDFAYNAASQFSSINRWSNLAGTATVADTSFSYDTANRVTDIDHKRNTTVIHGYDLAFDKMSRITSITSSVNATATFAYDAKWCRQLCRRQYQQVGCQRCVGVVASGQGLADTAQVDELRC